VQDIVKAFWRIALFRSGPQDLPDSRPLLLLSAALYELSGIAVLVSSELGSAATGLREAETSIPLLYRVLLSAVFDLAVVLVSFTAILFYFGYFNRLQQTLTAVFGVSALLHALSWPVLMLLFVEPLSGAWAVIAIALLLILLWSIAVYGHILAQAISKSFGAGVALSVLYFFLDYQLFKLIPDF
jgi:hypothetical protein